MWSEKARDTNSEIPRHGLPTALGVAGLSAAASAAEKVIDGIGGQP